MTSNPFNITGQFNVTFGVSGMLTAGSADSTGTVVSISGTSGGVAVGPFNETAANLPFTQSFDSGATVTYSYSSPVATGSATKQYRWNTTSGLSQTLQSNTFTVTATYITQYKVIFDATGLGGDVTSGSTIVTVNSAAGGTKDWFTFRWGARGWETDPGLACGIFLKVPLEVAQSVQRPGLREG